VSDQIIKTDVTHEVIEYIRRKIADGTWKEGEPIESEHKMAETLGVSRSSIRLAIRNFIAEGVLESIRGKGTFLKSTTYMKNTGPFAKEIVCSFLDLLQVRAAIEPECAALAAERATPEDVDALNALLKEMKTNENDPVKCSKYDLEFHCIIGRLTGNVFFEKILRQMFETYFDIFVSNHYRHGPESAFYYHKRIIAAIRKQDAKTARKVMRDHLLHNEKMTLD